MTTTTLLRERALQDLIEEIDGALMVMLNKTRPDFGTDYILRHYSDDKAVHRALTKAAAYLVELQNERREP
jgi:hypothetical protein